jgi:fatty acid desaturase (delta-4 desaturase)
MDAHHAVFDGNVIDLRALARAHPGGSIITSLGGTDVTAVARAAHHAHDVGASRLMAAVRMGSYEGPPLAPPADFDSEYARALRMGARGALARAGGPWAPTGFWVRALALLACALVSEWFWATRGAWGWGVAVAACHAGIGLCVQHDASHGAVSPRPWVNAALAHTMDAIGNSRWAWFQQHIQAHHAHTNDPQRDPDVAAFARIRGRGHAVFIRLLLAMLAFGLASVYDLRRAVVVDGAKNVPFLQTPGARQASATRGRAWWGCAVRLLYLARIVVAPAVIGTAPWWVAATLVPLLGHAPLVLLFAVSHHFEGARDGKVDDGGCWYTDQTEASASYGGRVAALLTGGLNFQIEHHVFPRVCSWHYPMLSCEVVRPIARAHGVRYAYFPTFASNLASTVRALTTTHAPSSSSVSGR